MIGGSRGAGGAGGADGAAEAAKQLEAYFLRQVLSTMPKGAMFGGDGAASSTLHGMFNEVLADAVAEGGQVGLAKELQAAMEPPKTRTRAEPKQERDPLSVADEITSARARENGVGQ